MSPTGFGQGYVRDIKVDPPALGNNLSNNRHLEMALEKEVDFCLVLLS